MAEPPWDLYALYLAAMREGSLSAAARSLGITQPTERRQLEKLESALEITLVARTPNGLAPTAAAEAMRTHVEAMEANARALRRSVSGTQEMDGVVRLSASQVVAAEVLPPMLASLFDAFPDLTVELSPSDANADLLRRDADIAVRMVRPTQQSLVARRIGEVDVGLFAHPRYLATHGTPNAIEDLRAHRLVLGDRDRRLQEGLETSGADLRGAGLRCDDDRTQLAAVRAGVGIGACQTPLCGDLVRVLPEFQIALDVWMVMHEDLRTVPRVRKVFDHLGDALAVWLEPR